MTSTAVSDGASRRHVRRVASLLWLAATSVGIITVVGAVFRINIGKIYDTALLENRAPLLTGEADELALTPGSVAIWGFLTLLATVGVAALQHRRLSRGRSGWRGMAVSVGMLLVFPLPVMVLLVRGGVFNDPKEEAAVFGYWYTPILLSLSAVYAFFLICSVVLSRHSASVLGGSSTRR